MSLKVELTLWIVLGLCGLAATVAISLRQNAAAKERRQLKKAADEWKGA